MTHFSGADNFIEKSVQLMKSGPANTKVSITYTHSGEKRKPIVKFKLFNPVTGICLSLRTHKAKEFSRIMNALGPRGTAVTKHVNPGTANEKIEDVKLEGLGCIMTNTKFSEQEAQEESNQETNQRPAESTAEKVTSKHKKRSKKSRKGRKH